MMNLRRQWIVASLAVSAVISGMAAGEDAPKPAPAVKIELTDADRGAIGKIRELGGQVLEVAQNDNRLEVSFHLSDAKVSDETLKPLAGLKCVVSLNVRGKEITDAGVAELADTTGLVRLHLERTKVTDGCLKSLVKLEHLEYLNLYGTEITDAGLEAVVPIKSLKKLYVWQTKVTIDGIAKLKAARPDLQIVPDLVKDKERAELEAKRKAEDEAAKKAEEEKKKAEEEKKKAEEKAEEEAKKKAEEEKKKADEAKKSEADKKPEPEAKAEEKKS